MKKAEAQDEMRVEYKREDLGVGTRGKYYEAYNEGHNLILLRPEVAKVFPSEEAANEALMSLIRIAQTSTGLKTGSKGSAKMARKTEVISSRVAAAASKVLRSSASSKSAKSAAGSALSQRKALAKVIFTLVASVASRVLRNPATSKSEKTSAGSALTQNSK